MDRIITDNSKVNENLLKEVNAVHKQNKELIVKIMDLEEQLLIQRVSQQRELLAFAKEMQNIGFNEMDDAEKVVDIYIKANCG